MSPKIIAAAIATASVIGSAGATDYCASDFCATLVESPARDILSSVVTFRIEGKGIRNAELVPQFNYAPIFATFTPSGDGTSATLEWDTRTMQDQRISPLRILVFDKPAGDATAHQITAMPARVFYVRNSNSACVGYDTINHTSNGSPALLDGSPTTKTFCDPGTWSNGVAPPDCECALHES